MKGFLKLKFALILVLLIVIATTIIIPRSNYSIRAHAEDTSIITEFSIPTSSSKPNGIISGTDGNLWFAEHEGNKIGRIAPNGSFTEFSVPTSNSYPDGITITPDGNLWFPETNGNNIGRITPDGTITEFPVPTSNSWPYGITTGPDHNIWFTEEGGNKIGRLNPSDGTIKEFAVPTSNGGPGVITSGPDGNLWFSEFYGNKIGRISPDGSIKEFPLPTNNGSPRGITTGPDGNIWFTEEYPTSIIGRITPSGTISEFPIPASNSEYYGNNQIERISPDGSIKEFPLPTNNGSPRGITTGPDGNIWFSEFYGNKIGRVNLSNLVSIYTLFSDHFDGTSLNSNLWTSNANGGTVDVSNSFVTLSANNPSTTFPYVFSKNNPFPQTGDFSAKLVVQYLNSGPNGNGIVFDTGVPQNGTPYYPSLIPPWINPSFVIWQGTAWPTRVMIGNNEAWSSNDNDTNLHTIIFKYVNGQASASIDGGSFSSSTTVNRLTAIWFGNPDTSLASPWTSFKIDQIQVSQLPDNSNGQCNTVLLSDDFNNGKGPGWWTTSNNWSVENGEYKVSISGEANGTNAYNGNLDWSDYDLEFDMRGTEGVDKPFGFRIADTGWYMINIRSDPFNDIVLSERPYITLKDVPFPSQANQTYHVLLQLRGNIITLFINGTQALQYVDTSNPTLSGIFALSGSGTDTIYYDNVKVTGCGTPIQIPTPTPTPSPRKKLFVLIQGIGSELKKDEAQARNGDGEVNKLSFYGKDNNIPGIVPFLWNNSEFVKNSRYIMYSYSGSNDSGQPNEYGCSKTFANPLKKDAELLAQQIKKSSDENTDVYLIGHSLGGVVALTYLTVTTLETKGIVKDVVEDLPLGAQLKAVITLDSPIGGISDDDEYNKLVEKFYNSTCNNWQAFGMKSIMDLRAIYKSASYSPMQGLTASIAQVVYSNNISNQQIGMYTATNKENKIRVMTIGNMNDILWRPQSCLPDLPNFPNTQWLADLDTSLCGRKFIAGNLCNSPIPNVRDIYQLYKKGANHFYVLYNSPVEQGILQFLQGKPITALDPNP